MNNFMQKFRNTLYKIMYGRYGSDEFSKFLLIFSIILFFVSSLFDSKVIYVIAMLLAIYNIFRCYSKDFAKRRQERDLYIFYKNKFASKTSLQRRKWRERKTHSFFACPNCGTIVRVPKGRGKIEITCPKCNTSFIKKT